MFDAIAILDALADAPPGAEQARLRVVEGRGLAVGGARVLLDLHPHAGGVGVRTAAAQAALDRFEPLLSPGRALRIDWLGAGGRNVPSDGRTTYFRVQGEEPMESTTTRTTTRPAPTVVETAQPISLGALDAGQRAAAQGIEGALLVALDRAQTQALDQARDAQSFAQQVALGAQRALGEQSAALRVMASSVAQRDGALINRTIDAERRAADAEAVAALSEGSTGEQSELASLVGLVQAVRGGGAADPKAILPALVKRLASGEGGPALRAALAGLSADEKTALFAHIQAAM